MITRRATAPETIPPSHSAHLAGLRYVTDQMPGIRRVRNGNALHYFYPTGGQVREREVLARIQSLAIPPAWTDVWICPDPCGHLQATGRDDRRRKQFRYHRAWREIRDETKYNRTLAFGRALPLIRKTVRRHLRLRGLPREKVLAAVVRLLELSLIRVGNEEYAKENKSFGLTTLRNKHVAVRGSRLRFHFRGKSGKWHEVDISDAAVARIVKRCQDLPGQELFQYLDDDGKRQSVHSDDVNNYLREATGSDFTAKDFRTWAGTVLAARALRAVEPCRSQSRAKKNVARAIEQVAEKLGNTTAVCRKCYVHPEVIACYLEGELAGHLKVFSPGAISRPARGLSAEESALLVFLRKRIALQKGKEQPLARLLERSLRSTRRNPGQQLRRR